MKTFIKLFVLILAGSVLISCNPSGKNQQAYKPEIKNVIFMIGDGMGLGAVYAAMTVSDRPLNLEKCTHTGFQKSFSADRYITDSAASGTALATGKKTNNGRVGVDPEENPLQSILKVADEHGLSTGLVVTSSITDATPAAFIAHNTSRSNHEAIAHDFLSTDINVFIGGGYNYFASRSDSLNLIDSLINKGYAVETSMEKIMESTSDKLAGFPGKNSNPYRLEGRGDMLPKSTEKAIEILSRNPAGFFLMVEGSQIDWAAHGNNQELLVDETLDFDEAIGVALDFAAKDGHTLVVITADHETGGVSIVGGDLVKKEVKLSFATKGHTGIMLPVYAYGPGSELFTGIFDNTSFFGKFLECYGF